MRRHLALLAGAICLSLGLSACGSTGASPHAAAGSNRTLVIWADQKRADVLRPFAEAFAAKKGARAEVVAIAENQQEEFVKASQEGRGPDVMVGAHDWIGNLVQNELIDPIEVLDNRMGDYVDVARRAVTYQGKFYAIPYAVESLVLFRNTALAPDAPRSFDELVATGESLRKAGKVSQAVGYTVSSPDGQSGDTYHMYPLFSSGGGYLFGTDSQGDSDPSDMGVGTPASVAAFEKIAALGEKGSGVLRNSYNSDNSAAAFTSGKTPFLVSGPWRLADVRSAGMNYAISPVPGFAGKEPARSFVGVQSFFVSSKGKNKDLGQQFVLSTLGNLDLADALFKAEPRMPALKDALDHARQTDPDVTAFEQAAKNGVPLPSIPQMSAIWGPFNTLIHQTIKGDPVPPAVAAAGKAIKDQLGH
ncbi:extracellular solute-binding protein [Kitasatospora paracochleata]|uniref:Arabinogalactan oligomer/maltooligosaccharide transport system substrate-binding protein n=1 Tax=Kitasatospora paracochleata TaxID=58354 RepID=A0ABT1J1T6_9ACTN|nr:maltose ABC transporter substrate-binding protein [Kitasatospora paracochleata]MCP2311098.1 arabinogalactan oligomer/maltooligosaccharide transport system substrate-binding protein [Kitasatospora paracochleata]